MRPTIQELEEEFAVVALGSNLGNSRDLVRSAICKLQTFSDKRILQSSLWETEPVDCPPGSPGFINAVAALKPRVEESPETLLAHLQVLEMEFGRRAKAVLNEPRPLDLDLITFGRQLRQTPALILPHPRAHLRRFVLEPLCEISPDFTLPLQRQTVSELLKALPLGIGRRIATD